MNKNKNYLRQLKLNKFLIKRLSFKTLTAKTK